MSWELGTGDVVSAAPELARLALNIAAVHHDSRSTPDGRRLVYGGHAIGLVLSQVTRCLPSLLTVVGWESCDHVGPVFEGEGLRTDLEIERLESLAAGGGLVHLRARAHAYRDGAEGQREVLDWRLVGAMA